VEIGCRENRQHRLKNMIHYTHHHRVRYRECDPMGVVYHTHYLDYFEAARTEALRDFGLAYRDLEEEGIIMPVTKVDVRYHRPARYDELLEIRTIFPDIPETRVSIDYEVYATERAPQLVSGRVELCFVNRSSRRPIAPPESIKEVFSTVPEAYKSDSPNNP
jgi:acyl-CoA thioester hydrolase